MGGFWIEISGVERKRGNTPNLYKTQAIFEFIMYTHKTLFAESIPELDRQVSALTATIPGAIVGQYNWLPGGPTFDNSMRWYCTLQIPHVGDDTVEQAGITREQAREIDGGSIRHLYSKTSLSVEEIVECGFDEEDVRKNTNLIPYSCLTFFP